MARVIINRLVTMIPVLLGVLTLVFLVIQVLPGDPVRMMVEGAEGGAVGGGAATEELIQQLREELGLNDPIGVQYARYLYRLAQGDLGKSFVNGRPVAQIIAEQFPSTFQLALAAFFLSVSGGIILGIVAAVYHGTWIDSLTISISVIGISMPSYWLGLLLILIFSVNLQMFPIVGGTGFRGLVLPAVALGASGIAAIARLQRSSLLDVLKIEYVTTARAKGLTERTVILRHAMRNALIPAVTFSGLRFGTLLGGTVIIEAVFARQGIGSILYQAVLTRDYPLLQGAVLLTALFFSFSNLIVDVLYTYIDPRIREV